MALSTRLVFMCVLGLLLAQGGHCSSRGGDYRSPVNSSCCVEVSKATINEPVKACFEQKPNSFLHCSLHAYILITKSDKKYCVDPSAYWLPKRLERLKKKGISCEILRQTQH